MPDTATSGVEIDTLFRRQLLDIPVFPQIGFGVVLDVVVERHDDLAIIVDAGGADGEELLGDGPGIVVRHAVVRLDRDVVAGAHNLADGETDSITLHYYLGQVLDGLWRGSGGGERASNAENSGGLEAGRAAGGERAGPGVHCGETEPPCREPWLQIMKISQLAIQETGRERESERELTRGIE